MFKKKKTQEKVVKTTVFDIPSTEAKEYLSSITKDVKVILENEKFINALKKVELSKDATPIDYENVVKRVLPNKVYDFMTLFIDDCFDNVISIMSALFVTNKEEYAKKSIMEICEDFASLGEDKIAKILRFFHR